MEFRETIREDISYMADHSISRRDQKPCPERINYCYTLEHEGIPLIVGGFSLINATTAWCSFDLSDEAGGHLIEVYRAIKEWGDIFVKEHGIRRLQCFVEVDFPEAIRVVERCGFVKEFEKPMKNFIDDKDAYLYVRLREDE